MTLSIFGTGSVTLSGTGSGTLAGTGASNRVSLTFTPTAGSCTFTVTGSVTSAMLEVGSAASAHAATTSAPASNGVGSWWLDFDGVDDRLVTSTVSMTGQNAMFFTAGFACKSAQANQCVVSIGSGGAGTMELRAFSGGTPIIQGYNISATGASSGPTRAMSAGINYVSSLRGNLSGPTTNIRLSGLPGVTTSAPSGGGPYSDNAITIGNRGAVLPFSGSIYAIVIGKGTITDADLLLIERYIGTLSGVQI